MPAIYSAHNIFHAVRTTVHSCSREYTSWILCRQSLYRSQAHQPRLHRPWWLHETSYKPERNGLTRVARYVCAWPGDYEPARCVYREERTGTPLSVEPLYPRANARVQDRVYKPLHAPFAPAPVHPQLLLGSTRLKPSLVFLRVTRATSPEWRRYHDATEDDRGRRGRSSEDGFLGTSKSRTAKQR